MKMRSVPGVQTVLWFAGLVAALASTVNAATISLNPVADTFVSSANPANNYGGAGALEVSAVGLANGEFQSLLEFNLSSAESSFNSTYGVGDWTVQSVSLQLTATPPNNGIFNTSAAGQFAVSWMQNDSWVEGTGTPNSPSATGLTYNTLPSFLSVNDQAAGGFSFSGSTSATASYSLSLVSGLVGGVTSGSLASLRLSATDSVMSGLFDSRSFGTVGDRPVLTITAVPEPSTWVLAVVGASGLALMRGRFVVARAKP